MKTQKLVIIVLSILLAVSLVFISINLFNNYKTNLYQEGAVYGYEYATMQMMQELATCNQVPVYANNITLNAIAVECLQQSPSNISK